MPILHLSQLIGVAAGLTDSELKFKRHVVSVAAGCREALRVGGISAWAELPRATAVIWVAVGVSRGSGCRRGVRLVRGRVAADAGRSRLRCPGLPQALDGMRIGHLSDFHLGAPLSRGNGASERAAEWVASRPPELVCITGDLVSLPRGEARLRRILACSTGPIVVLGNHDVAITRDPFSRAAELDDLADACSCATRRSIVEVRGVPVQLVGADPEKHGAGTTTPWALADTTRPSGSCSATTRPSSGVSQPGSSASRLRGICTGARSAFRCRAAAG